MTKPPANVLELPLHVRGEMALKTAVEKVILEHIRQGLPIYVWRDGRVVEVPADERRAHATLLQGESSQESSLALGRAHWLPNKMKHPRIEIEYCTQCRWLLRAAWMAQELLTTFQDEIGELVLTPGTGGVFEVRVEGEVVWSRAAQGRFPEIKDLKQIVRDRIAPGRDLGHSDR